MAELLVLAGGFGTRLRAAVADLPKPLAPVADRPFLGYQIDNWVAQGVRSMSFLLHHQAAVIEAFLQSSAQALPDCRLRSLTEPQPLGTGGAIAYAVKQLGLTGSFLIANADTWLGSGVSELGRIGAPAMAVVHVDDSQRYGAVRLQTSGKVAAFEEKADSPRCGWINAGLYSLEADRFDHWDGEPFSLEYDLFPKLVRSGELTAASLQTQFIDIGVPADYQRFCRWIEAGRAGTP